MHKFLQLQLYHRLPPPKHCMHFHFDLLKPYKEGWQGFLFFFTFSCYKKQGEVDDNSLAFVTD